MTNPRFREQEDLLTLATATLVDAAFGPYEGKESGETALLRTLLDSLRSQDVVVADSYYCSYWLAAMLRAKGADGVFRLHHTRPHRFRRGRDDQEVVWYKPQRHTRFPFMTAVILLAFRLSERCSCG